MLFSKHIELRRFTPFLSSAYNPIVCLSLRQSFQFRCSNHCSRYLLIDYTHTVLPYIRISSTIFQRMHCHVSEKSHFCRLNTTNPGFYSSPILRSIEKCGEGHHHLVQLEACSHVGSCGRCPLCMFLKSSSGMDLSLIHI